MIKFLWVIIPPSPTNPPLIAIRGGLNQYREGNTLITILYVEDEMDLRESISEELEDEDCTVLQAENGSEGLEAILTHKPDLVLYDINMLKMDGYELMASTVETNLRQVDLIRAARDEDLIFDM